MNTGPGKIIIILCLVVISGATVLSACATLPMAGGQGGLDGQVSTAVAATVVQHLIETKVAEQSGASAPQPSPTMPATEPPTPTPPPTFTPLPITLTPTATATALPPSAVVPAKPTIKADENTNCRYGPSTAYNIVAVFAKGAETTVEGRDAAKDWWYIPNPAKQGAFCWVWDGSTTVKGDTSELVVISSPAGGGSSPSGVCSSGGCYSGSVKYNPYNNCWNAGCYPSSCYNYCNSSGYPYNCWENAWNPTWNVCYTTCCTTCASYPWFAGCKDPCKKSSCPAVTIVNYKKYCQNYPQCCK